MISPPKNPVRHLRIRFLTLIPSAALWLIVTLAAAAQPVASGVNVDVTGENSVRASAAPITGATPDMQPLLQRSRYGADFRYVFTGLPTEAPVSVELGFAETEASGPGQRVFQVDINGRRIVSRMDVFKAAGGRNRAVVRQISQTPNRGVFDIRFQGLTGEAMVSYIRLHNSEIDYLVSVKPGDGPIIPSGPASWNPETGEIYQADGKANWLSGVPFGGLGTGKFEILPNGAFANFTINNSWDDPLSRPGGTFVSIAAKSVSGGGTGRLLQVREPGGIIGPGSPIRTPASVVYRGLFPFAEWFFKDESLPILVRMNSFSPLIPHNEADSALPAAVVSVDVENPRRKPVSVAIALSWENIIGRGGSKRAGDLYDVYPRLRHTDAGTSGVLGIHMTADSEPASQRPQTFMGGVFIGVETSRTYVTRSIRWNPRGGAIPWWGQFSRNLRLDRRSKTPGDWRGQLKPGEAASASICATINLGPGERRQVPFVISWYNPKIVTAAGAESPAYADRFASAVGVAGYVYANLSRLRGETAEWHSLVQKSNLPEWLKARLVNSLFPMVSNSINMAGGRFSMLESPEDRDGMLGGMEFQPAAVSFPATMFPGLYRALLDGFGAAQTPLGGIPSSAGNIHDGTETTGPQYARLASGDATNAWMLLSVQHALANGERERLKAMLPALGRATAFLAASDRDGDNLPEGQSFCDSQTTASGSFVYTSSNYLAALRALIATAERVSDKTTVGDYTSQFDRAREEFLKKFRRGGELYARTNQNGINALALAGDLSVRAAGLPPIFAEDFALTATRALLAVCTDRFRPAAATETDTLGRPASPKTLLPLIDAFLGCEAIALGDVDAGLGVLRRSLDALYESGRNPWGQSLVSETPGGKPVALRSTMAAMAAWNALFALSGVTFDHTSETLTFRPRVPSSCRGELHIPVFTPAFWGWLDYNDRATTANLTIVKVFPEYGDVHIRRIVYGYGPDGGAQAEWVPAAPMAVAPDKVLPLIRPRISLILE
ncbi:MAG: hypothetical protein K1X53_14560 [Candidatus Sumerlaeaceae bacterium]|nr:hypothetical protein [Candidatus Sumerlaeaceae bacterium]